MQITHRTSCTLKHFDYPELVKGWSEPAQHAELEICHKLAELEKLSSGHSIILCDIAHLSSSGVMAGETCWGDAWRTGLQVLSSADVRSKPNRKPWNAVQSTNILKCLWFLNKLVFLFVFTPIWKVGQGKLELWVILCSGVRFM